MNYPNAQVQAGFRHKMNTQHLFCMCQLAELRVHLHYLSSFLKKKKLFHRSFMSRTQMQIYIKKFTKTYEA